MKRILSIDGGGILGTAPAAFLANLEDQIGEPLWKYFDLIAGTSTGGIIAIALGLGIPANDVLRFYRDYGPSIFPYKGKVGSLLLKAKQLFASKYDVTPLNNALYEVLGDSKIGDSKTRLLIPSTSQLSGEPYVIKTAHHPRLEMDWKMKAVDAALATAAAPTYLPYHVTTNGIHYVDGGVWANNPSGFAVIEGIGVLDWPREEIRVLSLGCEMKVPTFAKLGRKAGVVQYNKKLVDVFMFSQSYGSYGAARLLTGEGDLERQERVLRYEPKAPSTIFDLDNARMIDKLAGLGVETCRIALPSMRSKLFDHGLADKFVPYHPKEVN